MLQKDVEWYLTKLHQISAFEKWIEVIKSDVPKQVAAIVKSAANAAISELESKQESLDFVLRTYANADGFDSYWSFLGAFNHDRGRGAVVSAWIPRNIDWMVSESDEVPTLGLYVHFSGSKRKLEEYGKRVSATVGKLPSREYSRIDKIEDDVFYCIIRDISYELSAESFFDQNALRKNLAKLFREFTEAMLPGLESGRTIMDQK